MRRRDRSPFSSHDERATSPVAFVLVVLALVAGIVLCALIQ